MVSKSDITVYIGRFSPFHKGHAHVLKQALSSSKFVVVLIGSAFQSRSLKNPFSFYERKNMIEEWSYLLEDPHAHTRLIILPVRDFPYNNTLWVRNVQRTVKGAVAEQWLAEEAEGREDPLTDIRLTGSDRDETTWYLKSFPQWKLDLLPSFRINEEQNISATEVRRWLFDVAGTDKTDHVPDSLPISTLKFLERFMLTDACEALTTEYAFIEKYKLAWKAAPYEPTFVTVDAVVVQSGHVLLVRRGHQPGKGLWALPGGFLNPNERLKDGAIRELLEETGLRLAEGKKSKEITEDILKGSIRQHEVFDKPDRSSRGRTITTAFLFRLDDSKQLPKVKGADDADDAFWVPIGEALDQSSQYFEDHHAIIETLIGGEDLE